MTPTTKKIVAGAGLLSVFGYIHYIRLSMYLGKLEVDTSNYILNENGKSFFLDIKITGGFTFQILPKYKISKVNLLVDKTLVATSTKVLSDDENFNQEFTPIANTNYLEVAGKKASENSIIEICYKTFLGLRITKQYEIETNLNQTNTSTGDDRFNSDEDCRCR